MDPKCTLCSSPQPSPRDVYARSLKQSSVVHVEMLYGGGYRRSGALDQDEFLRCILRCQIDLILRRGLILDS